MALGAFVYIISGHNEELAATALGLPFVVAGLLTLVGARQEVGRL